MKKLLSRADGSVEMVYKKVPDTSHVFTTKMTIKSSAWVFEADFAPGARI